MTHPEAKLQLARELGLHRIIARLTTAESVKGLVQELESSGVLSLSIAQDPPTTQDLTVLFRTARKGEQFPATILAWIHDVAVLKPALEVAEFKELAERLVEALEEEGPVTQPAEAGEVQPVLASADQEAQQVPRWETLTPSALRAEREKDADQSFVWDEARSSPHNVSLDQLIRSDSGATAAFATSAGHRAGHEASERGRSSGARSPATSPAPKARLGAFSPPGTDEAVFTVQQATLTPQSTVAVDSPSTAVPHTFSRTEETLDVPELPLEDLLPSALAFLGHLEIDPQNKVSNREVPGRDAINALATREAADWKPGAVLIASPPDGASQWYVIARSGKITAAYRVPATPQTSVIYDLVERGLLTDDAARRTLSWARSHLVPEETALLKLRLVDRTELTRAVATRVKWVTQEILAVTAVRYRLCRLQRLPGQTERKSSQRSTYRQLYALLQKKSWSEMASSQAELLDRYPVLRARLDVLSHNLGLAEDVEGFLDTCLSADLTLAEIYRKTTLTRARTFAVVFALERLGLLEFEAARASDSDGAPLRQWIERRTAHDHGLNDFEYLDLSWLATSADVERALGRVVETLAEERVARLAPDYVEEAGQILEESKSIHTQLIDAESRQRYRAKIVSAEEMAAAVELLQSQIEVAHFRGHVDQEERLLAALQDLDAAAARTLSAP